MTAKKLTTTDRRRGSEGEGDGSKHPLFHQIPDDDILEEYVNRKIYGEDDFAFMEYCMDMNRNVMFVGDTQVGKTILVSAYGAYKKLPVVTINANGGIDPNTFFGMWRPNENGELEWVWSEIAQVIQHGGILFVDEVNFMLPRIAAVFHSLADSRRQVTVLEMGNKVLRAHPDFLLVTAYNRGYEGTRPLNAAFQARFVPVEMGYDEGVESAVLCMPVTLDLADSLRKAREAGTISTPLGTGALIVFEEMAADIGPAAAIECLANRFQPEERSAVMEVIKLVENNINEQTKEMTRGEDDD